MVMAVSSPVASRPADPTCRWWERDRDARSCVGCEITSGKLRPQDLPSRIRRDQALQLERRRWMPTRLAGLFAAMATVFVPGVDDVARFEQPARGERGHAAARRRPGQRRRGSRRRPHRRRARRPAAPPGRQHRTGRRLRAARRSADRRAVDRAAALGRGDRRRRRDGDGATPGTRLSELNAAAAEHGLQLPIDLGADPAIGGMIATNTGGSRVLRYGPMRRYVLAAEIVAADDEASVFGSSVGAAQGQPRPRRDAARRRLRRHARGDHRRRRRSRRPAPIDADVVARRRRRQPRASSCSPRFERRRPGAISAFELVSGAALERTLSAAGAPPNPFGDERPERRRARRVVVRRRRRDGRRGRRRRRLHGRTAERRSARRPGRGVGAPAPCQREPAHCSAWCSATTCPCRDRR